MTDRLQVTGNSAAANHEMMRINGTVKFALFLALIGIFWACSGFVPAAEQSMWKLHSVIEVAYIAGAVIALWFGGEPIGTLQPISLRPIYILCGVVLMVAAFCAMLAVRSEKAVRRSSANHSIQRRAATSLNIYHPKSLY